MRLDTLVSTCDSVECVQLPASSSTGSVQAIVFDLDGVLRNWDTTAEDEIEVKHGLARGAIMDAVMKSAHTDDVITGVISDEQYREVLATDLTHEFGPSARSAVDEWSMQIGSVSHDVLAYVTGLRGTFVIALLSNATSRLGDDLRALDILDRFDHVFNTSEIGAAKPHPDVYAHVSRHLALEAHEWLFVDDLLENVRGAEAAGIRSHQFRDLPTMRTWIDTQIQHVE